MRGADVKEFVEQEFVEQGLCQASVDTTYWRRWVVYPNPPSKNRRQNDYDTIMLQSQLIISWSQGAMLHL